MLIDFQNSSTVRHSDKFAAKLSSHIPSHLKDVDTPVRSLDHVMSSKCTLLPYFCFLLLQKL